LIRHLFRGRSEAKVEFYTTEWARTLEKSNLRNLSFKGPAPAPLEKIKGYYRYHFFYFTPSVKNALQQLVKIREQFPLDPEIHDILDVDAQQIS
jgi:primosomal protein N' (replication factor Y)